ncbi:MAG: N-acetylmuramoyl-L-alanine amidase [Gudongella sp.]|jgi:N-acetylmuramoyl-L-alanine amidase|nr:N-acetylmuramoyl-L-alanine amidase [Gudongella sp.]
MIKSLIKYNYAPRYGEKIKYIVVHDTGNANKGAGARNHYLYFNSPGRNASSHYFVDSNEIWQIVEDENAAWHCGDGKGRYGITNSNSIGIELCINSDGNWEETKIKGTQLIRELLKKYNLPKSCVVRHYDASLKNCPAKMSPMGWREWTQFYDSI